MTLAVVESIWSVVIVALMSKAVMICVARFNYSEVLSLPS